jgi:hypothetical protein
MVLLDIILRWLPDFWCDGTTVARWIRYLARHSIRIAGTVLYVREAEHFVVTKWLSFFNVY